MSTLRELSVHLDLSERRVRDILRELELVPEVDGINAIRIAYIRSLREKAAGRGLPTQEKLNEAKIREANASADLKQFDYLQKAGAVVAVADIEPALRGWMRAARSEFEYAVEKLVSGIQSRHDIEVDPELIAECLEPAFAAIRNWPKQYATGQARPDAEETPNG